MEPVGVLHNENCDFLNKMFWTDEDADFAFQFLQGFGTWPTNEVNLNANANANFAVFDENLFISSGNFDTNFFPSQKNTNISIDSNNYTACFPNLSHENVQFSEPSLIPMMNDISDSMNFCDMDGQTNALAHRFSNVHGIQDLSLKEEMGNADITDSSIKWKSEVPQKLKAVEDVKLTIESVENPKKKKCGPKDLPKCKKNVQQKRRKGVTQNVMNDEDINYNGRNGQSSSSYSSEDDSNASQEQNGGATSDSKVLNSSGKPRAGRGAATDSQSLYARKRREKINERLRILQNLVPNGTKVDISTMLEEAVQYVKFLQLQIKLLSSDEMWMYAPIAYNGMDMGLYQKISPTL